MTLRENIENKNYDFYKISKSLKEEILRNYGNELKTVLFSGREELLDSNILRNIVIEDRVKFEIDRGETWESMRVREVNLKLIELMESGFDPEIIMIDLKDTNEADPFTLDEILKTRFKDNYFIFRVEE